MSSSAAGLREDRMVITIALPKHESGGKVLIGVRIPEELDDALERLRLAGIPKSVAVESGLRLFLEDLKRRLDDMHESDEVWGI